MISLDLSVAGSLGAGRFKFLGTGLDGSLCFRVGKAIASACISVGKFSLALS